MAGLPWFKVWSRVVGHPKIQWLERELKLKDGLGVAVRLWAWTADYAPDGEIPEAEAPTVAKFARGDATKAKPSVVLDALTRVGLLEPVPGGFRVHDWDEMQTAHVDAEEKRRAQAAVRQARYRERHGNALRSALRDGEVTGQIREEGDQREKEKRESAIVSVSQPLPRGGLRLAGEEQDSPPLDSLALFRSELAERLGLEKMLDVGRDRDGILRVFHKHLAAVGETCLLNDCAKLAQRSETGTPTSLAWFVPWLERLPMGGVQ